MTNMVAVLTVANAYGPSALHFFRIHGSILGQPATNPHRRPMPKFKNPWLKFYP